jgi:hypothetical protein
MGNPNLTIIDCLQDPNLMGGLLKDPETWSSWFVLLRAFFGLPMDKASLDLFKAYSGREMEPQGEFRELWCNIGRRSGKSFMAAVIAVFLAILFNYRKYLNVGERGVVQCLAADRSQASVIFNYIRGVLHEVPFFKQFIEREYTERLDLNNGISIEVMACSFRSIRGRSPVCAIFDEIAFWKVEGANPDREILAAVRPGMATIPNSKLIVISSPYAKFGVLYETYRDYHGTDDKDILVWSAPTTVMNPTIDQGFIDKESKKDPAAAASEWYGEFRKDIETFLSREALEAVIVPGCYELPPLEGIAYKAFCDPAGGSGKDSYALAISHYDHKNKIRVLDLVRAAKPPFSPAGVTAEFSKILKSYNLHEITGDRWGGEFPREAFLKNGISYRVADKPKSDLYRDFLPLVNSGKVELLDNKKLKSQLLGLERKTARSGKDSIDHGPRGHDDCANAAAGCLTSLQEGDPNFKITTTISRAVDYGHEYSIYE